MRRTLLATTLLAFLAALVACSSDAPGPTANKPGGGPTGASGLEVRLFTSNANPNAGTCTLLQAIVTLNGENVPDGTGVSFSTDFGNFGQNGQSTISIVTTAGSATTTLCSTGAGVANVRATATVGSRRATGTIAISFQASESQAFVTFCSPTFGTNEGGTTLTVNGGRFFGDASTTRVTFTAAGVTREALVTSVTPTGITVVTPAFPEATSPSVPVQIRVTLGANTPSPVTLNAPNCFAFGTTAGGTPSVTAVLPSSGKNEGNTRVSIIGSGFVAPLQVFFGNVEAQVLSVSFNQIVALSPPAFGAGAPNLNQRVDVRVHEVVSGLDGTLAGGFRYTPAMALTAFSGANLQPASGPFTPLTLHGQGFDAPVAVSLAGIVASVVSVSATEIVVVPGAPLVSGCSDVSGTISVTNVDTGETVSGLSFTYLVTQFGPVITSVSPSQIPEGGGDVTITGTNLFNPSVTVGGASAAIVAASAAGTSLTVHVPPFSGTPPTCPTGTTGGTPIAVPAMDVVVTNRSTKCPATAPGAVAYLVPCTGTAPPP